MPITPTKPIEVATEEVVKTETTRSYDRLWLRRLNIDSPSNEVARCNAELLPFNSATGERAPDAKSIRVSIPNIFALLAKGDAQAQQLGGVMEGLLAAIETVAKGQGKI